MLAGMTAGQMAELITELYDNRKEARDFLEFYMKPDIVSRVNKARAAIAKEANRNSRNRNRARVSKLRGHIKDISSLNPGAEIVCEIMTYAIEAICTAGSSQWIASATGKSMARLLEDTMTVIDRSGLSGNYLPRILKAVDGIRPAYSQSGEFKERMQETLGEIFSGGLN